jgi:hypothetical protein
MLMLNVALAPALFRRDSSGGQGIVDDLLREASGSLVYVVILDERGRVFSGSQTQMPCRRLMILTQAMRCSMVRCH